MPAITWLIETPSPSQHRLAEEAAREGIELDRVVQDVARAFPAGEETTVVTVHHLRSYFEEIDLEADGSTAFTLTFHVREDAGRFWKDLMIAILSSIKGVAPGASIRRVSRSAVS